MRRLRSRVQSINLIVFRIIFIATFFLSACAGNKTTTGNTQLINTDSAILEVQVKDGVSYQDVIDSLKSISEGMNFVNPANFPIGDHIKQRGVDPQGIKEVHSFCNLTMGTDIFLDHPEFLVFAPCRIAIYEKQHKLFIALARPTYDLKNIKNPTMRAQKAAQQLEHALIQLLDKASKGEI